MRKAIQRGWIVLSVICILLMGAIGAADALLPLNFSAQSGRPVEMSGWWSAVEVAAPSAKGTVQTAATSGSYTATAKLFGLFPIKQVAVKEREVPHLVPGGTPFGIKLYTDGVMVVGMADVDTVTGCYNPAKMAGVRIGDMITRVNGQTVTTNEEVASLVEGSKGKAMAFSLRRDGINFEVRITPAKYRMDGSYKTGLWVRDSSAGVGTLTFYDPASGVYGGLGHGVCDVDTGEMLPLSGGEIVPVELYDVVKGERGNPGELRGGFAPGRLGSLLKNGDTGVYGVMERAPLSGSALPVAFKQQIKSGKADILTTVSGDTPTRYTIEIEQVRYTGSPGRNMVIRVTDPDLLALTGGIVQGMSGSPIIQNGKLVGAVTHVYVNDPTRGYGIFAETMLDTANQLKTAG